MSTIFVSEKHQFDSSRNIVICSGGIEKPYRGIDIKIEIYESRVNGWFFDISKDIVKDGMAPGDYVAVMIALSYIEGVEQFMAGKETPPKKSREWFKKSAKRIFPDLSVDVIDRLWTETRCGLFHAGFPNGKIYLSHCNNQPVIKRDNDVVINPNKFTEKVTLDFEKYLSCLRDKRNCDLRENFERLWDYLWKKT